MYETCAGDTWDSIAYFIYNNEMYAGWLMKNNPFLLGICIFPAGVYVYTPNPPTTDEDDMPEWRD